MKVHQLAFIIASILIYCNHTKALGSLMTMTYQWGGKYPALKPLGPCPNCTGEQWRWCYSQWRNLRRIRCEQSFEGAEKGVVVVKFHKPTAANFIFALVQKKEKQHKLIKVSSSMTVSNIHKEIHIVFVLHEVYPITMNAPQHKPFPRSPPRCSFSRRPW